MSKTANFTHEDQLLAARDWMEKNLLLDTRCATRMSTMYDHYLMQTLSLQDSLPLKGKTFSREVRLHFKKSISRRRVLFKNKKGVVVEGVKIRGVDEAPN